MQEKKSYVIDWLSLSPRTMAQVMDLSNRLGITPKEAFAVMVEETAESSIDLHPTNPHPKKPAA